ncbi:MAG: type I phosphomannose isomerase catalytic subunit [Planctomycetaceae bacterium]
MEPLLFEPLIRQSRWGGRKLGSVLHKPIGSAADYAESWEIADQPGGQSTVAGGTFAGTTLAELLARHPAELLGRHRHMNQFPLLIKFLDASDWLSLQVHPNDTQAKTYDIHENGKTEAWVILHADPDSRICAGLKAGVTRETFESHLANGTIEDCLHLIPAKAGDCIFVPANTVHALGPGILLAEVQQQSNLTFRLYDWGRMGSDGKPRETHIAQSLACINFDQGPVDPVVPVPLSYDGHTFEELVRCDYFVIRRHDCVDAFALKLDDRFRILMLLDGEATLRTHAGNVSLKTGNTALLPASITAATVDPSGRITLLEILHP